MQGLCKILEEILQTAQRNERLLSDILRHLRSGD